MKIRIFGVDVPGDFGLGTSTVFPVTGKAITRTTTDEILLTQGVAAGQRIRVMRADAIRLEAGSEADLWLTLGPGLEGLKHRAVIRAVSVAQIVIDVFFVAADATALSAVVDAKTFCRLLPLNGSPGYWLLTLNSDETWRIAPPTNGIAENCTVGIPVGDGTTTVRARVHDIVGRSPQEPWTLRLVPRANDRSLPVDGTKLASGPLMSPMRLINGLYCVEHAAGNKISASWQPWKDEGPVGAVLLGLHDEEGLPLVVEATLPQTAWRLTMRENRESGVAGEPGLCLMPTGTSDVATGALKELTQAIFDPASTLRYGDLDVRIRRLRWLAAVTDTRWRVADVPGKERRVVVQDQAPRSIKGFALDTQVTCARAGARQGIPAKLCFNQVHGGTGSIAFSAVELLFGDTSANWRLEMQYAEEDKAGALFSDAATAGVVQIDRFSSHSKPGTFALPVSDARAAFRDTNSDKWWGQWQQASSTALAMAFKELTPAPLNETASVGAGFSRKDSAAQPLLSVLGDRKKLARSDEGRPALAGTVRMRPRLGTKQVSPTPAPGNHIPIGGGALGLARWLSAMVFGQTQQETDSSFGFGDGLLPAGQIEEFEQALNRRIALIEQLVLRRPTASLACTARANSVPCTGDLAKYTKLVDDIKAPGDAWQMVREKWTESRFATDGCAAPLAEHIRLLRVLKQLLAQGESTLREQLAALAAEASDLADPKAFDAWWQQGAPLRAVVQQVLREAPKTRSAAAHLLTRMLQRLAWQAKAFDDDRYARFVSQLKKLATKIGDVANDMNNTIDQLKGLWPTVAFLSVAAQQTAAENVEEAVSAVVMTNPMVVADVAAFLKACRQAETELGQQGKEFLKELIEFMAGIESFATAVNVPSLDHLARVGEDMVVQRLQEVWDGYRKQGERWLRDHEQQQRDELRKLLQDHPILNDETLKLIRDLEAGVRSALAAAANLGEAGADLLREVRSQPLDYVAIGRGVNFGLSDGTTEGYAAVRSAIEKLTSSVGRPLAVCDLGSGFSWDYLACENSVYLLKLGKRRPLDDILGELHERVRTDELPDPLRLVGKVRNTDPKPEAEKEKIRTWVSDMVDAEVAAADWQGLIILKPSIDFSDDKMTSEMCGLSQLTAEYVAFSGGTRDRPGKKSKSMQVWARIRSEAPKEAKENGLYPREAKDSDGALTLIEFDAHIRGTRLLPSSRVEMRLDMGRLFGKKAEDAAAAEERSKWRIRIVGRVIEPQKADAAPRFEFTAALEDALQIDIDKLFFKSIEIRRIEGVYRNQRATLAVNASIALKSTDGSAFQTSGDGKLMLSDFRMVFPRLDGASAVGRPREMRFDLGSLRGLLNPKRALTLGNFEFEVVGFGYLRSHPGERVEGAETADWRERDEQRKHLNRCFKPIGFDGIYSGSDFDAIGEMPYVVFSVTFGGLPVLDRKAASKLRIGLLVGLMTKETGGSARNEIVVAAGDLDASKIDINLFRVIRIQIERLLLLPDERSELDGRQYSAFYVEDFRLNILGWNLIGNQSEGEKKGKNGANVLHMQDHKGERGFAVFVPEPNSGDLIEMQWLLIGRNLALASEVYLKFLTDPGTSPSGEDPPYPLLKLEEQDGDKPPKAKNFKAMLAGNNAWLFGTRFNLKGNLVKNCALVMQDGVFYGIRLQGPIIKALFKIGDSGGGSGGSPGNDDTLVIAYKPGESARQDRFYFAAPIPLLNLFNFGPAGQMVSGLVMLGWSFNTDALVGLGFPYRVGAKRRWEDAFSFYCGIYQAKFGFYLEKRSESLAGREMLVIGGGLAIEFGYGASYGGGWLYIRAGIGVFVVVEGDLWLKLDEPGGGDEGIAALLQLGSSIKMFRFNGEVGLLAYVEGAINIWIISARFRAELQASIGVEVNYNAGEPILARYRATLYAGYYARACMDLGLTDVCYEVQGEYPLSIEGTATIG